VRKEDATELLSINGREVRVTNPGKLYFSKQTKLTKLALVRYYLSYVNGAAGEAFYQKRAPAQRPSWLRTITLAFPSGRTAEEIVVDDAAGLAWIVILRGDSGGLDGYVRDAIFHCIMTLRELMETSPTNEACKQFLMERRWPDGKVKCPRCGKPDHVYEIKQPWKWECSNKACRKGNAYRFSIIAGTIFENTNYPLKTWFEVLWQLLNSKKGVSALQIQRQIGCGDYRTAWYMCHRLRAAMYDPDLRQLMGIVWTKPIWAERTKTSIGIRKAASLDSAATRFQLSAPSAARAMLFAR
jgi:transposase-like protein